MTEMTPQERQQLRQLIRLREQRAKHEVDAFADERIAQFEQEMATVYRADDERWARIKQAMIEVTKRANEELTRICEAEGIREEFAPTISPPMFIGRGENANAERRAELRKVAQTRVKADSKAAKVAIEAASAGVQEQLLIGGLKSEEAKALVETMPTVQSLMPPLHTAEIIEIEQANGHKRRDWRARHLPPLQVPALIEAQEEPPPAIEGQMTIDEAPAA
jgi:hypothetical protein